MKKIFNILLATMLVIVSVFAFAGCDAFVSDEVSDTKGLLVKKNNSGDYVISKYTQDEDNDLTGGVLDIDAILTEKNIPRENETDAEVIIKAGAFDGNIDIKTLIVSSKVTKIEKGAFKNMKSLEKLEVPFVGKTVNADAYYGQTASATDKAVDTERTLAHFFGETEYDEGKAVVIAGVSVYVPYRFTEITVNAVKGHDVIFGEEVKNIYSIPYEAFSGAINLRTVTLKGVAEIGEQAFSGCTGLKEIEIPDTVETIYDNAFKGCINLASVEVKGSDVVLKDSVFAGCKAMDKMNAGADDKSKFIDLSCFSAIGENALDFGRSVTFNVETTFAKENLNAMFGETKWAYNINIE